MKKIFGLIGTTVKGGIFFLLPLALIFVLLGKVLEILEPLSASVQEVLDPGERYENFPYLFSILTLILVCFAAGWIAKLGAGQKMIRLIEDNVLSLFPGYSLMKSTLEARAGVSGESNFPVVLVPIDGLMFGFHVDTLDNGDFVVFIPGAPSAWEGNVVIFPENQVTNTDYKQDVIIDIMRQLGTNTNSTLLKSLAKNKAK
ncbi:hypothetical protein ACFOSV_14260 [Algoriphagus namhaensis]|uniref:DUF502 domain-containing protein n=1 Tax=Algoriphagus namhaensis TaxID=915353 RepID=A0ABV8ATW7_9BACT